VNEKQLIKRKKRLIMMNKEIEKNLNIYTCKKGDLVETVNGEQYIFQKLSRVNFVGKSIKNDLLYNVRISSFFKVKQRDYEKHEENVDWMKDLKKDDMFYIVKNSKCLLYKFVRHTGAGILALNPYDGMPTRISAGFEGKKL
jgi:hypothetical protein